MLFLSHQCPLCAWLVLGVGHGDLNKKRFLSPGGMCSLGGNRHLSGWLRLVCRHACGVKYCSESNDLKGVCPYLPS